MTPPTALKKVFGKLTALPDPTLSIDPDQIRSDPIGTIIRSPCVGCGPTFMESKRHTLAGPHSMSIDADQYVTTSEVERGI